MLLALKQVLNIDAELKYLPVVYKFVAYPPTMLLV